MPGHLQLHQTSLQRRIHHPHLESYCYTEPRHRGDSIQYCTVAFRVLIRRLSFTSLRRMRVQTVRPWCKKFYPTVRPTNFGAGGAIGRQLHSAIACLCFNHIRQMTPVVGAQERAASRLAFTCL